MKFGADRKRIVILSSLVLVAVYVLWSNVFSGSSSDSATVTHRAPSAAAAPGAPGAAVRSTPIDTERVMNRRTAQRGNGDWHPPVTHVADPLLVDPTLRLDLLAKVQQVGQESGAQRNIFAWGDIPKPPDTTPLPKVTPIGFGTKGKPGLAAAVAPPPGPTTPPPPPPIALKYYGFSTPRTSGHKRAFFLDGDDIILASEGDTIKRRYKLVKIGVNSVTMEDTQFHNNQQTLPLIEDLAS